MENFIKATEVMENLGVTIKCLDDMIKRGDFPKPDLGGRGVVRRWKESTIKNWEDSLGGDVDHDA